MKINRKGKVKETPQEKAVEFGLSKFMYMPDESKVVPADAKPKSTPVDRLYGSAPVGSKYQHASKPWKPKGRK